MMTQANLASFVTYNPIALSDATCLTEALQTLAETGIHQWPVLNDQRQLVGILSEQDVVRVLTQRGSALVVAGSPDNRQGADFSVADSMSKVVEFVTLDESPRQVLKKLLDFEMTWLPVIQDEMVVGVTSVTDYLREFSYGQTGLCKLHVSEVMEPVEVIAGEATLAEAWEALEEQATDCLGVVRGDFPLGVLSARDLQLAKCRVAVSDWLNEIPYDCEFDCSGPRTLLELVADAPTIRPGERLQDAAMLMLDHNHHAIAVVNQANRLMGAVTEQGILRRMLNYLV